MQYHHVPCFPLILTIKQGRSFRLLHGLLRIYRQACGIKTLGQVVRHMDFLLLGGKWSKAVEGDIWKACPQAFRCITIGIGNKGNDPLDMERRKPLTIGFFGEQRMPASLFIIKRFLDEWCKKINTRPPPH